MRARRAQTADPRDTATPGDMTTLLMRLWKNDLLTAKSSRFLLDILDRCETGKSRIKGLLPQGTDVAHKTGSVGGVANDVGFMTLLGDAGHIAVSIFTKGANKPEVPPRRPWPPKSPELFYDYFVLVPAP